MKKIFERPEIEIFEVNECDLIFMSNNFGGKFEGEDDVWIEEPKI